MNGQLDRFRRDLDRLCPGGRIGVAVSGGPDSLALLLLTSEARPGMVEAATVEHGLRPDSAKEAAAVAASCARLGVPHSVIPVQVSTGSSLQAQAREARYRALAGWATERGLSAILTAHHADDQAETLLMRLARGAGLGGLAGVREVTRTRDAHGPSVPVIRPLLAWRKTELVNLVSEAGLVAAVDPANSDPRHDRTRVRALLGATSWLDPRRLAASAGHLAEAEAALSYCTRHFAAERIVETGEALELHANDLPRELQRRLLLLAFDQLGAGTPRGPDLDRALTCMAAGGSCTLAGLKLAGGTTWTIAPAPPRSAPGQ